MTRTSRPFVGLSAFPPTPLRDAGVDEDAYAIVVGRLAAAGVDSIGALGSTGSYAYLSREERASAARVAVQSAAGVPVLVGVGAVRTSDVLRHADDAREAGAAGLLLAPVSYQPLTDDEVFQLFVEVTEETELPVVVYDNPGTTKFVFSDELHARIAQLDGVVSIKIPPVFDGVEARVGGLRALVPDSVGIGISGDGAAAGALLAGCDTWYSAIAGLFPERCLAILAAARDGRASEARRLSDEFAPVWALFARHGSYRVVLAAGEYLGLLPRASSPRPILPLDAASRAEVVVAVRGL